MRNKIIHLGLTLIIAFCLNNVIIAQITRGAQPGELYISSDWYLENNSILYYAILLSTDNGESISLQYANIETPPTGEMKIGKVLGDATPGALYNYGNSEQWVSFDYGESWEYRENYPAYTSFYTGVNQGLIFKGNNQGFFKSTDYAATFELLPINVTCPFTEVGFSEPEFYGIYGEPGLYYKFVHTLDYGQTYNEIPIDSLVAFWAPSGQFPKISRGAEQGELYLTSWTPELHYKVFHSVDTGYTWTEKYESDYIDVFYWGVQFTAGRELGSFYVMRTRINPTGDHVWLYIDYSSDYGETFTTYFHDLDSTITGLDIYERNTIHLSNYPNPFNEFTSFSFNLPANCKNAQLNIYDLFGNLKRVFDIVGNKSQVWNGKDTNGKRVKTGIYLYNIYYDNCSTQINKLILTH